MQTIINGEAQTLPEALTLAGLMATLGLKENKVAIEVNRVIIPRSLYGETPIREGDEIEIVQFIGGG